MFLPSSAPRWFVSCVLWVAVACTAPNPRYCDAHEDCASGLCDLTARVCREVDVDAPPAPECRRSDECPAEAPICTDGACAPCQTHGACAERDPAAPYCGWEGTCVACVDHGQCGSQVCDRVAGACVAPENIIHLDPAGTDSGDCTEASRCRTLVYALDRVQASRRVLWMHPGTYTENAGINGLDVYLVAGGATLTAQAAAVPVLQVRSGGRAVLDGLAVEGGFGGSGADGILCGGAQLYLVGARVAGNQGQGVNVNACKVTARDSVVEGNTLAGIQLADASARLELHTGAIVSNGLPGVLLLGGELVLHESEVRDNAVGVESTAPARVEIRRTLVRQNRSGGIRLADSSFLLENNFVVDNGSTTGGSGGVFVENSVATDERSMVFNTVAGNQAPGGQVAGVRCSTPEPTVLSSNLVWGNSGSAQYAGTCSWEYSNTTPRPSGAGNLSSDPMFVDAAGGDYHIAPGSPAVNAASPSLAVTEDFDGDARPRGAGPDMGADEAN